MTEDYLEIPHGCVLGVKTIIMSSDNQLLVLKRSNVGVRAGGWDFAGGLVEVGENPEDAAIREVKEETGLIVKNLKILGTTSKVITLENGNIKHTVIIGYSAIISSGIDVQLSEEHTEYKWLDRKQVETIALPDDHKYFLSLV